MTLKTLIEGSPAEVRRLIAEQKISSSLAQLQKLDLPRQTRRKINRKIVICLAVGQAKAFAKLKKLATKEAAQQIIDDLDVLLPIAEGASSRPFGEGSNPEKLDVGDFGSSPLHPLYSLDPSLRLLTAARNGDIKQVRKIETKITLSLQEFEFDDNILLNLLLYKTFKG